MLLTMIIISFNDKREGVQRTNRPLLICVPIDLWIPEQRIHKKTPLCPTVSFNPIKDVDSYLTDSKKPSEHLGVVSDAKGFAHLTHHSSDSRRMLYCRAA